MPAIPVTSALSYIGVFSLIFGFFLVLAGLKIVRIEKITVASGRKTWVFGIVLVLLGIIFLFPDISSSFRESSPIPTATIDNTFLIDATQFPVLHYKVVDGTTAYEQPDTSSRVIEEVSVGQVVELLEGEGDWIFGTYTVGNVRTTGWIQRQDLEILK